MLVQTVRRFYAQHDTGKQGICPNDFVHVSLLQHWTPNEVIWEPLEYAVATTGEGRSIVQQFLKEEKKQRIVTSI